MGRAPCCDKASVKKGPWSPEEDAKLKQYMETHGSVPNWISLPQNAGLKRCGKSCRLRWLNYLRPNIKHGEFTETEDRIICSLYANIGSRWSVIAAQLRGRTDNDIKNYWNTKLKKKVTEIVKSSSSSSSTRIKTHQYYHQNQTNQSTISFSHLLQLASSSSSLLTPSSPSTTTTTTLSSSSTSPYKTTNAYNCYNNYFLTMNSSTSYASLLQNRTSQEASVGPMFAGDQVSCSSSADEQQQIMGLRSYDLSSCSRNYSTDFVGSLYNENNHDKNGLLLEGLESDYSLDNYGIEEIKKLISSSSSTCTNSDYYDDFLFDVNETETN